MANPGSIMQQLGESFEDLGKDIVRETVQAPKDIVGAALESVGVGGGKKQKQGQQATSALPNVEPGSAEDIKRQEEMALKKAIARAALQELAGGGQKQKEPTVWEKIQQEEQQKKEQRKMQNEASRKANVPQTSSKRKRGDLYGMKAKKSPTEISKNTRQD